VLIAVQMLIAVDEPVFAQVAPVNVQPPRTFLAAVFRFLAFVATPLPTVTLGDLQAFADALEQQDLAPSSRVRTLAAIKSLLAFGQRTGYLPLNVGAALKLPPKKDRLAEHILSETQVHRILALEPSKRNQALLRVIFRDKWFSGTLDERRKAVGWPSCGSPPLENGCHRDVDQPAVFAVRRNACRPLLA